MSLEAITKAIHEYLYERLNDSTDTEEEKRNTDMWKIGKIENTVEQSD